MAEDERTSALTNHEIKALSSRIETAARSHASFEDIMPQTKKSQKFQEQNLRGLERPAKKLAGKKYPPLGRHVPDQDVSNKGKP